ncbi:MAG: hypothetical protein AAB316_13905 [Bacteroidota bacterium]
MSEFQCYKFKTIDRPLTESERKEVNALSSRGEVSANSATFLYHYSDFRHKPEHVLEKYFDAMLYFTNWGTKRLMFRLPAKLTDAKGIKPYLFGRDRSESYIELVPKGEFYLLDIELNEEEGGGWMEEEDFDLGDLTPLRDDILNGDYRALYLAWAKFSQPFEDEEDEDFDEEDEDETDLPPPTPPVPANLKRMSAALKAFTNFFEIDKDLVSAAQAASPETAATEVNYENLLRQLPENERLDWLSRLLKGEARLEMTLKKRLEKLLPAALPPALPSLSPGQLRTLSAEKEKERKAREEAEARAAHEKRMRQLAGQEETLWKSVQFNIQQQTGKAYELATEMLKDLKDLAAFQGKAVAFQARLMELREKYARSRALIGRWEQAGLFR